MNNGLIDSGKPGGYKKKKPESQLRATREKKNFSERPEKAFQRLREQESERERENREEGEEDPRIPLKHRPASSQKLNHSRTKEREKKEIRDTRGDVGMHERGTGRPATGGVQNSRMKKMQHGRQNGKIGWCRCGSIE